MAAKQDFLTRYRRGIRTSLRNNSSAYGYTIVVTCDVAMLNRLVGSPSIGEIYAFIIGAVGAFALLEASVSRMFREKLKGEPSNVMALGSSFSIVSISVAVSATLLCGWLTGGWFVWGLSAFGSTAVYLLILGIEMALAEGAEKAEGE